ncbi:MAG: hypothetical protein WAM60_21245 [Candidatus Promineifilaceae bacterium]
MSDISVSIDNRVRLVAAVLAASYWPDHEQAQDPHAVHTHAKMTRQYVSDFTNHPAVTMVNASLENGRLVLPDLFAAALRSSWPLFEPSESLPPAYADEAFLEELADFYTDSAVAAFFWADHNAVWDEAAQDLGKIFQNSTLPTFLSKLLGQPLTRNIVVIPNLSYPTLQAIAVPTVNTHYLILPPPRAYGESPPWPYHEDPGWVVAQSCYALTEILLEDVLEKLENGQGELLRHAAVTLCLEETLNPQESSSYLVRSKKQYDLPELPATVDKMREHLKNPVLNSLADLV